MALTARGPVEQHKQLPLCQKESSTNNMTRESIIRESRPVGSAFQLLY